MSKINLDKYYHALHNIKLRNQYVITILMFLSIFILIAGKRPSTLFVPYLYSEDLFIFIQRAMEIGHRSVFIPYMGYFHFFIQTIVYIYVKICALIGSFIPLPYMMQYTAHAVNSAMLCYFLHSRFRWVLDKKRDRFIILVFIILLIPLNSTREVWATLTMFQWWAVIFIFLCGLDILYNKDEIFPPYIVVLVLMIIAFSSPAGLFALMLFALKYLLFLFFRGKLKITASLTWHDLLKFSLLVIPCIVQITSILNSDRVSSIAFDIIIEKVLQGIKYFFIYNGMLLEFYRLFSFIKLNVDNMQIIIGIFSWLLIFLISVKTINKFKMAVIYGFIFNLVFLFYIIIGLPSYWGLGGGRYSFLMAVIFFFFILIIVSKLFYHNDKAIRVFALIITVYLCILSLGNRYNLSDKPNENNIFWSDYSRYIVISSENRIVISPGWQIAYIPISFNNMDIDKNEPNVHIDENDERIQDIHLNPLKYYVNSVVRISGLFTQNNQKDFKNILIGVNKMEGGKLYYPAMLTPRYDEDGNFIGNAFYVDIPETYFYDGVAELELVGIHTKGNSYSIKNITVSNK